MSGLPGFRETPPLPGEVSIRTLADAVTDFLTVQDLVEVDAVGSSMGARLVLELRRRGVLGFGGVAGSQRILERLAKRASALFPSARLHCFDNCGLFPH